MFERMFNKICYGVFMMGYGPFVILMLIAIGLITQLFQLIASGLPQYLLFGISLGDSIKNASLPNLFVRLAIISILVFAIMFVLSAIRMHFYKEGQANPIRIAMKNSIVGTLWLIGVPIGLFLFNTFVNIIMDLILNGAGMPLNQTIFMSLHNPEWKITKSEWAQIAKNKFYIPFEIYEKFKFGEGIMLVFIGAAVSVATLIPFAMGLLTLVQKVFQQFFLFILSPFIAAASIADDGKRMKQWQDMYMAKSFAILGLIISIQLFGAFLTRAVGWTRTLKNLHYALQVLMIFGLAAGGAVATNGIGSEITAFVGESASVRETMSETKGMIASGMALAGAGGAVLKAAKAMGGNAVKSGLKMAGKNKLLERMDAKSRLKSAFKSGKVGLSEYRSGLAELKADKLQSKQAKYAKEAQIENFDSLTPKEREESGYGSLTRSEMNLNDDKLISKENKASKAFDKTVFQGEKLDKKIAKTKNAEKLNKLMAKRNVNSEKQSILKDRFNDLNSLINQRLGKKSEDIANVVKRKSNWIKHSSALKEGK